MSHARELEERARQAAALDAERRTLRALVEAVPAGIVLVDRQDRVTTLSRLGAEQLGLGDPEPWIGRTAREVFAQYAPQLAPGEARRVAERFAWETGDVESYRMRFAAPAERVLELSLRAVRAEDGERLGQLWVNRDVTDARRGDEQLQRARPAAPFGALAGDLARGLDADLAGLLARARALRASAPLDDPAQAALRALERDAARCAEHARGLAELALPVPPAPQPVEVEKLLRELESALRPTLPPGVTLEVAVAPGLDPAQADPAQLRRALASLAANARDAVGAAGAIVLRAHPLPGAPDRLALEVADDGVGIEARALEQLFDPFGATRPDGRRAGLGLAIVEAIAEAHDAAIEVASEPRRGTVFRLVWPTAAAPGRAATVLLAEDEPSLRRLARLVLEREGHRVLEAEDGDAAVALFARHRHEIAVAVLDLGMPRRDGLAALGAMRAVAPDLPAVLVTGQAEALGADPPAGVELLAKPFRPEALASRVRAALARPG